MQLICQQLTMFKGEPDHNPTFQGGSNDFPSSCS